MSKHYKTRKALIKLAFSFNECNLIKLTSIWN